MGCAPEGPAAAYPGFFLATFFPGLVGYPSCRALAPKVISAQTITLGLNFNLSRKRGLRGSSGLLGNGGIRLAGVTDQKEGDK